MASIVEFLGSEAESKLVEKSVLLPDPAPGEILCEIAMATICGSDLHTISGKRKEPTPGTLGHEAVACVVNSAREGIAPGDRITFHIANTCGECDMCRGGLEQKCAKLFKYGHALTTNGSGLNGCYASHILLRAGTHVVKIPDEISNAMAAPVNCALATMVCAMRGLSALHPGFPKRRALVQGGGLLGVYACALLREAGFAEVDCCDPSQARRDLVSQFGATAYESTSPDAYPYTGQVDAVFEVCGVPTVVQDALRVLRFGGTYILVGMVHPDSVIGITGEQIIRKCLSLRGVHNYGRADLDDAVSFLSTTASKYPYESLVSEPYPLDSLDDAVQVARSMEFLRVAVTARSS